MERAQETEFLGETRFLEPNLKNEYTPDWVSPPGETLLETLEALGMSQTDLANRMGRPQKTINEIIKGKAAITPETALQLEKVLNVPARFWLNREQQYRESLVRQAEHEALETQLGWLDEIPVNELVQRKMVALDLQTQTCQKERLVSAPSKTTAPEKPAPGSNAAICQRCSAAGSPCTRSRRAGSPGASVTSKWSSGK
ncbi:MAG: HigA family addiction module antidote protein [Chloroflexi bacterium]|nr:HigA family addiction module antidote protein [Chloroflexota bacterium]